MSQPTAKSESFFEESWEMIMDPKKHLAKSLAILDKLPSAEEMAELCPQSYDAEPVEVYEEESV